MINKYTLDNGLRIVAEKIDYVKSVSLGIWVKVGSVNENETTNGMSHFIEHMLFKGTTNRSANKIAEDVDDLGGQINAFTSKECTCFYIKVLDENLDEAIDILSDMFFNSTFNIDDIQKEISVVIEEIKMYEDSPEDVVHEKLTEIIFNDSPLALPILGLAENLKKYTRESVLGYMTKQYIPQNTVISIAGNFDEEYFVNLIKTKFTKWNKQNKSYVDADSEYNRQIVGIHKDLEQLHICLGTRSIGRHDKMYYPLMILNNIFGGTMSSRLFQEVREKRGLVYSIYSFTSNYCQSGMFGVYAGLTYDNLENALITILAEMENVKNGNISIEEFKRAKQQIKGNYILGLESTSSRMSSIGRRELMYEELRTQDEIIESINSVKFEEVIELANSLFDKDKLSIVYTGNLKKHENLDSVIKKIMNTKE